jgi:1,4-alpha-glucan branching enzyme
MITCAVTTEDPPLKVTFRVDHPPHTDGRVSVVGDFNEWDRTATVLTRQPDGSHAGTVALRPERYRFRYVTADGQWFDDDHAHGYEHNELGDRNCVLDLAVLDLPRMRTDRSTAM